MSDQPASFQPDELESIEDGMSSAGTRADDARTWYQNAMAALADYVSKVDSTPWPVPGLTAYSLVQLGEHAARGMAGHGRSATSCGHEPSG